MVSLYVGSSTCQHIDAVIRANVKPLVTSSPSGLQQRDEHDRSTEGPENTSNSGHSEAELQVRNSRLHGTFKNKLQIHFLLRILQLNNIYKTFSKSQTWVSLAVSFLSFLTISRGMHKEHRKMSQQLGLCFLHPWESQPIKGEPAPERDTTEGQQQLMEGGGLRVTISVEQDESPFPS